MDYLVGIDNQPFPNPTSFSRNLYVNAECKAAIVIPRAATNMFGIHSLRQYPDTKFTIRIFIK